MKSTNRYYNPNPKKDNAPDCVIRALCKALDKDWIDVYDLLVARGRELYDMPNSVEVMASVLLEHGFERVVIPKTKGKPKPTVDQIARKTKNKSICVCRIANHIVTTKDGFSWDMWDSGDRAVYTYFEKPI